MTSSSSKATVIFGSITALVAWIALGLQLYLMIDNTPGNGMTPLQAVWRFLLFFTVLTNLLVALSLTIFLVKNRSGSFLIRPAVMTAIAMYILVVGIVYNAILRNQWNPQGSQKIADELLHVAVPLLYILWWIFFAPKVRLLLKQVFSWLLYPFFYLIYALIRGNMENFYAYPFIDVKKYGYNGVLLNAAVLMVAFIIIGSGFILMTRILTSERPQ